jgi:hypothetical protein
MNHAESYRARQTFSAQHKTREFRQVLDRYERCALNLKQFTPPPLAPIDMMEPTMRFGEALSAPPSEQAKPEFWAARQSLWTNFCSAVKPLCIEAVYRTLTGYDAANKRHASAARDRDQAEKIIARSQKQADGAALFAKFDGREADLVMKLREKFGDAIVDEYSDVLVPVENSIAYRSGSYVAPKQHVFVHVWTSHAEAKRYCAAFQRVWQVIHDTRVPGLSAPFTALLSCQTVYVTATTLVWSLGVLNLPESIAKVLVDTDPVVNQFRFHQGLDGWLHPEPRAISDRSF